jgi:aminopeptidase Y
MDTNNLQLVAHSVATYARSFEGFPERDPIEFVEMEHGRSKLEQYSQGVKYHGSKMHQ